MVTARLYVAGPGWNSQSHVAGPPLPLAHDRKIENMEVSLIKLSYHNRGRWVLSKHPQYVEGKNLVENGDIDFLSFTHMIKKYKHEFGMHESDDGINDIVASVLELNYAGCIHVCPYDEMVLNHNKPPLVHEMVVNQPDLNTQASANLMCEAPDLGLKTSEIEMGTRLHGGKMVVDIDKGKQLVEDKESEANEFEQDGSMSDSQSESGGLSVHSSSESSDSSYESDENEVGMQIINQSKRATNNRCKSDACDNNFCESFNASIREAMFKPIMSMLDEIREAAMARLGVNREFVNKWTNKSSPSCLTKYQENMDKAFGCKVVFNGNHEYEVGDDDDRHVVRLDNCMCTCSMWDINVIPCCHAICALNYEKKDPKTYISCWYEKTTYMATYQYPMQAMKSLKYLRVDDFAKCEPPPTVKLRKSSMASQVAKGKKSDAKGKMKTTDAPKCIRKTRRTVGIGLHIDDVTGNSTLNPGMSSESIIHQRDPIASQSLCSDPDPITRFPIPNQRELRQEQRASRSSASRRIAFAVTGNQAILPINLSFKPPRPTWKGLPCTNRTALEKQRDAKKNNLKK
ncbi:hypothetical protein C2S51_031316 [Perilla frutescens var. frutescens]|nr:hypothetical protein C2S51_031316 [Perilla frutescens var. frutescens]